MVSIYNFLKKGSPIWVGLWGIIIFSLIGLKRISFTHKRLKS